ncbi:MAG: prepilin-type N-terminal cleavage/methylation domain-containing protein [Fimbriimonas sp.]|nr:prepilin-type N-terminal cleavage/methylation domain-containing protein [Fimbriimonas sp.]
MRKAFTLIELLVVIAIIAILASILFPVFAQAKAAAKKTQALSNVKQLSTAMVMYIGDYDGTYYEAAQGLSTGTQTANSLIWNGWLQPYIKSTALALDPANTYPVQTFAGSNYTGMYYTPVDYKQLSIGYNAYFTGENTWGCLGNFTGSGSCYTFFSEGQFEFPSQQLLFANSTYGAPSSLANGFWVWAYHNINTPNGISDIHSGFTVVSFQDSHAKATKSTTLLVSDQVAEIDPNASGQCVNYDAANIIWDPTAPIPSNQPLCEGHGIR